MDISSSCIGAGLVGIEDNKINLIEHIHINPPKKDKYSIVERLDVVANDIELLCQRTNPDYIIIEDIVHFMAHKSTAKTIITLGIFNRFVAYQVYKSTGKIPIFLLPISIRSKLGKFLNIKNIAKEDIPEILQKYFGKDKFAINYIKRGKSIDKPVKETYDEGDACFAAFAGAIHLGLLK